jgi:cytochrome c-type biogenesis protein CcmF
VGEPSVRTSLWNDVYLTLEQPLPGPDGVATIRVIIQPLVSWLWVGGALMALGTLLAAFPGRRRRPIDPVSGPVPGREQPDDTGPGPEPSRVPVEVG